MFIKFLTLTLIIRSYRQFDTHKKYDIMVFHKQNMLNYNQEFNMTNMKSPEQRIALEIKNNHFNITKKNIPSTIKFIKSVNGGIIITINSRPICKIYNKIIPCRSFENPHEFKLDFQRINGKNAVSIKDISVEDDSYEEEQKCISLQKTKLSLTSCNMMENSQLWIMLEKTPKKAEKLKNIYNMRKINKLCNILESEIIKKKSRTKPNKTVIITTEYIPDELSDDDLENIIVDCSYNDILSNLKYACYTKYKFLNLNDNSIQSTEKMVSKPNVDISNETYNLQNKNIHEDISEDNYDDLLEKLTESCNAQQLIDAKLEKRCTGFKNVYQMYNGKILKDYMFAQPSDHKMDLYYKKGKKPKCNIELFINYVLSSKNELIYPEGVDISGCEKLAQMLIDIN